MHKNDQSIDRFYSEILSIWQMIEQQLKQAKPHQTVYLHWMTAHFQFKLIDIEIERIITNSMRTKQNYLMGNNPIANMKWWNWFRRPNRNDSSADKRHHNCNVSHYKGIFLNLPSAARGICVIHSDMMIFINFCSLNACKFQAGNLSCAFEISACLIWFVPFVPFVPSNIHFDSIGSSLWAKNITFLFVHMSFAWEYWCVCVSRICVDPKCFTVAMGIFGSVHCEQSLRSRCFNHSNGWYSPAQAIVCHMKMIIQRKQCQSSSSVA